MGKILRVFFVGTLISAIGTLPLGTLNIIAMQLSVAEGYQQAIGFALGAALVEMIYVRISLVGMDWVRKRKSLFKWLDWIAFSIVLALAIANFVAAREEFDWPCAGGPLAEETGLKQYQATVIRPLFGDG
ncbi:MAG: hypothetical protein EOO38_19930 [Cytophagaceae bacterium]|nr:MAG: hypothetical protein EOO38_19930 [Cytophagaceae bacterium]